ncbi:hypothetical protein CNMCM5623_007656 [Aspergillus felis]|uniref:DNA 3'-5' helicase n=1 Tax=Aspergillus felis TaxID=1287682 RepID=A0A8H6QKT7_9EURO|nr:hypothetical protein CNMCM5623_007656 [Aspergillus felis]
MDADAEEGMDIEQWMGHIADLQAAHSSHVAGMVYGWGIQEQAGSTAHRREIAPGHPSILGKRKQAPWEDEAEVSRMERRHQLATMDLEAAAQRMTGRPDMRFQGVQDPAIQAIQQGESPVVAVMPTSGGKSMLFMVPAFTAPGGTTIVVVPLVALQADMTRRCQELSISCMPWESWRPPDTASIMLVTPESAVSPDFQTFLNRLRWTRRLDRIVINKYHMVLNDQQDFRPQMAQLGRLVQAHTQMVWLTATLPPSMEDKLCRRIKHDQAAVTIYRARTSRPNVAYRVWRPDMTGVGQGPYQWIKSKAVVVFIQDHIQQATRGKVIIYTNIIRQVTAMARVLGCEAYYSKQLDKARVLAQFMGASPVIAATSALGMGVDIPNIRSIIHIRTPRTLLDYAQESGRAGWDRQHSKAIIIQPVGWDAPAPWMEGVAPEDQEQVAEYMGVVEGVGCQRVVLDEYLDGVVDGYQRRHCQDADAREQACDGCNPNWEGPVEPARVGSSPVPGEAGSRERDSQRGPI